MNMKFVISLLACLMATSTWALATPDVGMELFNRTSDAAPNDKRDTLVCGTFSYEPYAGKGCTGKTLGGNTVDRGTRYCGDFTNARSIKISPVVSGPYGPEGCSKVTMGFHHGYQCTHKKLYTETIQPEEHRCFNLDDLPKNGRVSAWLKCSAGVSKNKMC